MGLWSAVAANAILAAMSSTFDPKAYWEARLAAASGLQGVGFMGMGQEVNNAMYQVRVDVFRRTVSAQLPSFAGLRVLDTGSGTGFYVDQWRALGVKDVCGSDLTATAVNALRSSIPGVHFEQWDASDPMLPFEGQFDAISCMDMLFHIVDDRKFEQALSNFRRMLKPGGLLVFSDNFIHGPITRSEHFVGRDLRTYQDALERVGFGPVTRKPMFVLLNYPADSNSPILHRWWGWLQQVAQRSHARAGRIARAVIPLERWLVRLRSEGPSTEIAYCRAVAQ
jgi:SAM-dependent methyltransferase